MISVVINKLPVLQFDNLCRFSELFHFSSTRVGGCSTGNYSSLNLGFNSGDHPENVTANRLTLCTALEINSRRLVFPKQTHSAMVKTIQKMGEEFGSESSDILAGIGPSISPDVYEVGAEVWNQFDPEFYRATNPAKPDKRLLDLWSVNKYQLIKAGVPAHQIEVAGTCTFSDPDRFFSARRDGQKTGRMETGIMIR